MENIAQITSEEVTEALELCTNQILRNLSTFTYKFPSPSSDALFYTPWDNRGWTTGFWTGQIWLAYEFCGKECLREAAQIQCDSFYERIVNKISIASHDMGFLYSLSCVASYKLTGDVKAKEAALMAADNLISMYRANGAFIQSLDRPTDQAEYRLIIDCLMNLPLLYWAADVTGDEKYRQIALKHYKTTEKLMLREDGSTAQAALFDVETGKHLYNYTRQGYRDDSAWARGQAWAIYGPAVTYSYTGMEACKDMFRKAAKYYVEHLPEDMVPYFDLSFTEGDEWPRDSSAAAIAACGMLEMSKYLEQEEAEYYTAIAKKTVKSLCDYYMIRDRKLSNGLLTGGTYCCKTPYNLMESDIGKNECCSFGDYFFMEALIRLHKDWEMYW